MAFGLGLKPRLRIPLCWYSPPQFDDEFVKAHHGAQFESADAMRKGLLAETAMQRIQELDKQLEDKVLEVSRSVAWI